MKEIELLEHHRLVVEEIEDFIQKPSESLSQRYDGVKTLTISQAVEEHMRLWDDDAFYHYDDSSIRKNSAKALTKAVQASLQGRVSYYSDETTKGDIICEACYWNNRNDADPASCPLAYYKKRTRN